MVRDLVLPLSYATLRGRRRSCFGRIAPRHWHVELAAVAIAASALSTGSVSGCLWADCALGWTLLCLAWIDWDSMTLPNVLTCRCSAPACWRPSASTASC